MSPLDKHAIGASFPQMVGTIPLNDRQQLPSSSQLNQRKLTLGDKYYFGIISAICQPYQQCNRKREATLRLARAGAH